MSESVPSDSEQNKNTRAKSRLSVKCKQAKINNLKVVFQRYENDP